MGHEYVGTVSKVGEGVREFSVGDRVISLTAVVTCNNCSYCRQGLLMLCNERKSIGSGVDGAMAEYLVVPERMAFKIPKNIEMQEELALYEPLACCIRAVNEQAPVKAGDVIVVSGPGVIGQLTAQLAKLQGGYVIMSGRSEDVERITLALNMGSADEAVTSEEDLIKALKKISPNGADAVFECAGAKGSLDTCINVVKKAGHLAQVGLYGKPVEVDLDKFLTKELSFSTSYASEPTSWDLLIKLLQQDKIKLNDLASPIVRLDDWEDAFDSAINKKGYKVVMIP